MSVYKKGTCLDQLVLRMAHKSYARIVDYANNPAARSKFCSPECVVGKAPLDAGLPVGEACSEVPGLAFAAFQLLARDFQLFDRAFQLLDLFGQMSYAAS